MGDISIPRSLLEQLSKAAFDTDAALHAMSPEERKHFLTDTDHRRKFLEKYEILFAAIQTITFRLNPLKIVYTNPQ